MMKTIEKIFLISSITIWLYLTFLIHWDAIDNGATPLDFILAAGLSLLIFGLILTLNMVGWGVEYSSRKKDCKHENIKSEDGLDECEDCGKRNY